MLIFFGQKKKNWKSKPEDFFLFLDVQTCLFVPRMFVQCEPQYTSTGYLLDSSPCAIRGMRFQGKERTAYKFIIVK